MRITIAAMRGSQSGYTLWASIDLATIWTLDV